MVERHSEDHAVTEPGVSMGSRRQPLALLAMLLMCRMIRRHSGHTFWKHRGKKIVFLEKEAREVGIGCSVCEVKKWR